VRIAAGRFKGRRLPEVRGARPVGGRLKTSLFSVLAERVEGARVLDLCAGVGGLGLEALSRGARHVTLVELQPETAAGLRAFLRQTGCESEAEVRVLDALGGELPVGPFDLIFLDPPFEAWQGSDPATLLGRPLRVLAPEGVLIAKVPARLRVPSVPGFRLERRTKVASVAYLLLEPA